jgi:hypothetical protein
MIIEMQIEALVLLQDLSETQNFIAFFLIGITYVLMTTFKDQFLYYFMPIILGIHMSLLTLKYLSDIYISIAIIVFFICVSLIMYLYFDYNASYDSYSKFIFRIFYKKPSIFKKIALTSICRSINTGEIILLISTIIFLIISEIFKEISIYIPYIPEIMMISLHILLAIPIVTCIFFHMNMNYETVDETRERLQSNESFKYTTIHADDLRTTMIQSIYLSMLICVIFMAL